MQRINNRTYRLGAWLRASLSDVSRICTLPLHCINDVNVNLRYTTSDHDVCMRRGLLVCRSALPLSSLPTLLLLLLLLRQNSNLCDETASMYECVWGTENAYRGSRVETKEKRSVSLPVKPTPRKEDVRIKQKGHLHAKNARATGTGSASSRTRMTDNLNSIMISLDYLVAASDTCTPAFITPRANTKGKEKKEKKKIKTPQIIHDTHRRFNGISTTLSLES